MPRRKLRKKIDYADQNAVIQKINSVVCSFSFAWHIPFSYFFKYVAAGDEDFENHINLLKRDQYKCDDWYVGGICNRGYRSGVVFVTRTKSPNILTYTQLHSKAIKDLAELEWPKHKEANKLVKLMRSYTQTYTKAKRKVKLAIKRGRKKKIKKSDTAPILFSSKTKWELDIINARKETINARKASTLPLQQSINARKASTSSSQPIPIIPSSQPIPIIPSSQPIVHNITPPPSKIKDYECTPEFVREVQYKFKVDIRTNQALPSSLPNGMELDLAEQLSNILVPKPKQNINYSYDYDHFEVQKSALVKFIATLCKEDDESSKKLQYVCELIQKKKYRNYVGPLQNMVLSQVKYSTNTFSLTRMLQSFNIMSRCAPRFNVHVKYNEPCHLPFGLHNADPYNDIICLMCDNLGFKGVTGGSSLTYDEYVTILYKYVKVESGGKNMACTAYETPRKPSLSLQGMVHVWNRLKETIKFGIELFKSGDVNDNNVNHAASCEIDPDVEDNDTDETMGGLKFCSEDAIKDCTPISTRFQCRDDNDTAYSGLCWKDGVLQTKYDRNRLERDIINENLAKTATVKKIIQMLFRKRHKLILYWARSLRSKAQEEWADDNHKVNGVKRILLTLNILKTKLDADKNYGRAWDQKVVEQHYDSIHQFVEQHDLPMCASLVYGVALAMDGQPVGQANRMRDSEKQAYRKLVILEGGFHWEKNVVATTNKLFDSGFLRSDIETHRTTVPQQTYFMDPSDPTTPAKEKRMMILGWCLAAIEACVNETHKSINEVNEIDVIDHLKNATKDNALAGAVFLDMILSQIPFVMIDCETRVTADEVGTSTSPYMVMEQMKDLAIHVMANRNNFTYIRNRLSRRVQEQIIAPELKKAIEKELHTLTTKFGGEIYLDHIVEYCNKDYRTRLGSARRPGLPTLIKKTCTQLDDIARVRHGVLSSLRGDDRENLVFRKGRRTDAVEPYLAKVLYKTYKHAKHHQYFKIGARNDNKWAGIPAATKYCKRCGDNPAVWGKKNTHKLLFCPQCVGYYQGVSGITYVDLLVKNGMGYNQGVKRHNVNRDLNPQKKIPYFTEELFQIFENGRKRLEKDIEDNYSPNNFMPKKHIDEAKRFNAIQPTIGNMKEIFEFQHLKRTTLNPKLVERHVLHRKWLFVADEVKTQLKEWADNEADYLGDVLVGRYDELMDRKPKPEKYEFAVLFCDMRRKIFLRDPPQDVVNEYTQKQWDEVATTFLASDIFNYM